MAFYHPNRLSCLRVFPYDRFKIYTIIPIELNSIQLIEVVSVVRVICWNNQDDHMETRHACLIICITLFPIHCTIHPWIQSWPLFFNHHPASKCKPSNLIEFSLTNHTQPSANEHNQKLSNCSNVFFFFRWGLECVRISSIWFEMLPRTDLRSNDYISLLARGITSQRGPYTQKAHTYSSLYFPPVRICQSETQRLGKQRLLYLRAHLIWQTMFYKIELATVVKTC